jgi:hypothetical protein
LYRRLDNFSGNHNNNINNNDYDDDSYDSYGLYKHDDKYYLDIGSEPPRFAYYRHIRAEKWKALGEHKPSGYNDDSITQDELDYYLKSKLRVPPEQRYEDRKKHWYFHESSWYMRGLNATGYDGYGCNQITGCIPECRFYAQYGRIEDEEVLHLALFFLDLSLLKPLCSC